MPYYQGDFYKFPRNARGDYYAGDPGFFSFLSGLAKPIIGGIPGVGPILSSLIPSGETAIVKAAPRVAAPVAGTLTARATGVATAMKGGILKHPVLSAAGAAGAIGALGGAGAAKLAGRMRGMRKRRRMRVTNPKALRRAIRRTTGFAKLAMRTIHLIHPRKKARFGGFKRRVRR